MLTPRLLRVCLLASAVLPQTALAQSWGLEVRRVSIDHDPPATLTETGEQIPIGWGVAARFVASRNLFVQLEHSIGAEQRRGAICGGFIIDPATQCIPEQVEYSGGLTALSAGFAARIGLGSHWSAGVRPSVGLGALRAAEHGRETGRTYSETRPAILAGVAAETTVRIPDTGLGLIVSVRAAWMKPFKEPCLDCRQVFWRSLSHIAYGAGLEWHP